MILDLMVQILNLVGFSKFSIRANGFWILVPTIESWFFGYKSWFLDLGSIHQKWKLCALPCAFSKVAVLNPISILVVSFHLSIVDSNHLEVVVLELVVSRPQIPCRPTWGSKYAAMRKELELGARSRLPALEGVRGAC